MASQALYLKWRPLTFEEVVGQDHVTHTLRNALVSGRIGHAYLFAGPRGTGKTTMARVLAKAVNCLAEDPLARPCNECPFCVAVNQGRFLDLIEIDAASNTSVEDVRDLRDRIAFAPNEGRYKIYIIDEVHRFSGAAFDALLKTLEEPPPHAIFILATTEVHKVPQTILSRCQRFDFRRIPLNLIVAQLQALAEAEEVQVETAALELIARQATGSLRDAVSLLDQLTGDPGSILTLDFARAVLGTATGEDVHALTNALIAGDTAGGFDLINQVLDQGTDARQLAGQMVEYLRRVMLVQMGGTALVEATEGPEGLAWLTAHADQIPRLALLHTIRRFNQAATDSTAGWQPQLPLELAFLESVEALHAAPEVVAPAPHLPHGKPGNAPSPAPGSPPPEKAPPTPGPDRLTLAEVQARWREVLLFIRERDKLVEALLKSCTLYRVDGLAVFLLVPSEILRDKIEQEHHRALIEQAFHYVFGQPLKMRCGVGSSQAGSPAGEADDTLTQDSLAAFAVNELGGRVKRVSSSEENLQ